MAFSNVRSSLVVISLGAFASASAQDALPKPPQVLPPVVVKKEQASRVKRWAAEKKAPAPKTAAHEALPVTASEQTPAQSDESVVYSANRSPTDITKVGSAVDVIASRQIDAQSRTYVQDYLAQVPGVNIAQTGPSGTSTYTIWGAYSRYIKVQIDGIDVSDPTQPQTSTPLEYLVAGDVNRVEVLKGSQSLLYGGEAAGGVISIDTARPALGATFSASGESGSYNTQRGIANAGYGAENGLARFSVQSVRSNGYSAADERNGNTEKDSYRNLTFSGSGEYKLSDTLKIFFAARSVASNNRYDDGYDYTKGVVMDGWPGARALMDQQAGRVGAEVKLFDGAFVNTFAIQGMTLHREQWSEFLGGASNTIFDGDRWKAEYLGNAKITNWLSVIAGADYQQETANTTGFPVAREADLSGVFGQLSLEPIQGLTLTGGARNDTHSAFGDFETYRFTSAYFYEPTATKLRASTGTGFRAPSLYELYAPYYGNPALKPEESQSWDAGFDQWFANRRYRLSATYFLVDTTHEIQYDFSAGIPGYGQYVQVPGTTHREGVEVSGAATVTPFLSLSASYTYVDARQDDGARLIRIPRNSVTIGADAVFFDTIKASVTAKAVLDTVDTVYPGRSPLEDYVLLNAKLSYDIRPGLTAYVRGENLLDQKYETVHGFGAPGLSVFGGLTFSMDSGTLPVSLK